MVSWLRVNVLLQTERRSSKDEKISKCTFQAMKFSLRHTCEQIHTAAIFAGIQISFFMQTPGESISSLHGGRFNLKNIHTSIV